MKLFQDYRRLLVMTVLALMPLAVQAATWERKEAEPNHLSVEGTCSAREVTVYLYPPGKSQPVYSAGALCQDGHFTLNDDLSAWEINVGEYEVTVGEGQHSTARERAQKDTVTVTEPVPEEVAAASPMPSPTDPNSLFIAAQGRFDQAVELLTMALQDMKTLLPHTNLAGSAKAIWSSILETMEQALALLRPLSLQLTDFAVDTVEKLEVTLPSPSPSPAESAPPVVIPTPLDTPEASLAPTPEPSSEPAL